MERFPEIAQRALRCLERRDLDGFRSCVDENFDTRAGVFDLTPRDRGLVAIARAQGAAAKLCGSGGAVIGVPNDTAQLRVLEADYRNSG